MNPFAPKETWIVVPSYNEGAVVASAVAPLVSRGYAVVVVDDGSSDDTADRAQAAGAAVIRHALNCGQGAALQTGIDWALSQGAQCVCTYDGDGQHNVDDLQRLIVSLASSGSHVALGSRFLGHTTGMPLPRLLLLKAAVLFTRLHAGLALSDTHNGLRAFTRDAASKIRIRQPRMAHASEILEQIARLNLKYVEVPVTVSYSSYSLNKGQSGLGSLRVLLDLWIARALK